jgi:hypothetical protein
VLIVITLYVIVSALREQYLDSRLVNLAGKQRARSQRLCKTALLLTRQDWFDKARKERAVKDMQTFYQLFKETHTALIRRDSDSLKGKNSEIIHQYFL